MARLWSCGFELQSVTAGVEIDAIVSTPTIDTTTKRSGSASLLVSTTAADKYVEKYITASASIYTRAYVNITTRPASDDNWLITLVDTVGYPRFVAALTSAGKLKFGYYNNFGAFVFTSAGATTLSNGTWYRLELYANFDSTTQLDYEVRINGTTELSGNNVATSNDGSATCDDVVFGLMGTSTAGSGVVNFDDIAVNTTSGTTQTSWPGIGSVVHIHPNASGDNSGQNAGTYASIDEVTPNDATDYIELDDVNDIAEFNCESSSTAGIASGSVISLVQVGVRHRPESALASTYKLRIKGQASGTVAEGTSTSHNDITWKTNGDTAPAIYTLTSYTNPQDSAAWETTDIDDMQIGIQVTDADPDFWVSTLWALVEYITKTTDTKTHTVDGIIVDKVEETYTADAIIEENYYWVGGGGYWSDPIHWSRTSGGETVVVDSYNSTDSGGLYAIDSTAWDELGQSFTGDGRAISQVKVRLKKYGSPTGSAYIKIYAHSGTYGSTSVGTGTALATSDAYDVSILSTSYAYITFTFSGAERITLTDDTNYVLMVSYGGGDSSNSVWVPTDNSSPTHGGNLVRRDSGTWSYVATDDLAFYVQTEATSLPTAYTNVHIDSSSGFGSGGTISLDGSYYSCVCHNLTSDSGHTFTIDYVTSDLAVYGSLDLEGGLTFDPDTWLYLASDSVETITSNGCAYGYILLGYEDTYYPTGTWELQDDIEIVGNIQAYNGTLDANNKNVTVSKVYMLGNTGYTPTLYMGSGTWELTGYYDIWYEEEYVDGAITVYCETSTVKATDTSSYYKYFYYSGSYSPNDLYNVWLTGSGTGSFRLFSSRTINSLTVDTPPKTVLFEPDTTTVLSSFDVVGSSGNLITLDTVPEWTDGYTGSWDDDFLLYSGGTTAVGQSFTGDDKYVNYIGFYLSKYGSPTGNATVSIYAHSGTFGTSSVPTGSALATSDPINVTTIDGDNFNYVNFYFSDDQRIVLEGGTDYVVVLNYSGGNASNWVSGAYDSTTPTHSGNYCSYTSSWSANSAYDIRFYIYATAQATLSCSSGVIESDYLNISNLNAAGGATWYAGINSIDSLNNDGWIFGTFYDTDVTADALIAERKTGTYTADAVIVDINAVSLNGSTQYGTIPNFSGIDALTSHTIEGWFYNDSTSSGYSVAATIGNNTVGLSKISTENGTGSTGVNFYVDYSDVDADGYASSGVFDQNSWVHVAITHDASTKQTKIYRNGTEISYNSNTTGEGTIQDPTGMAFLIGHEYDASSDPNWKGKIGGFIRVWGVARSQSDLSTYKSKWLSGVGESNLIVNLNFTEKTGTTIDNDASAGNDMSLSGTPSWVGGPAGLSLQAYATVKTVTADAVIAETNLAEILVDTFNDNSFDSGLWYLYTDDANMSVDEVNETMQVTAAVSTSGDHYDGYGSAIQYNLVGSSFHVKVVQTLADGTPAQTLLAVEDGLGNSCHFKVGWGNIYYQYVKSGVGEVTISYEDYDPSVHVWWRLRESSGVLYYDTSPDGENWTNQESISTATVFVPLYVSVFIRAGTGESVSSPGIAIFDYFGSEAPQVLTNTADGVIVQTSAVNLTSGSDTDGNSTATTASISPSSDKLILLTVASETNITTDPNQPTATGNGLTWEVVNSIVYDTSGETRRRVTVLSGIGTTSTGAISIAFGGQNQFMVAWNVEEIAGANTVVQSVTAKDETGTDTTPEVTLATFSNTNNAAFGAFSTGGRTWTAGSGFRILSTATASTNIDSTTEFQPYNDISVDAAISPAGVWGGIAIELGTGATEVASFVIDGIIKGTFIQTNTADGLVKTGEEETHTADSIVKDVSMVTCTADSTIKTVPTKTHTASAIVTIADAYWVGGTGSWSDATNHWSDTSNGTPGAGFLPTASTNVHFDEHSFTDVGQTVTVDTLTGIRYCKNLDFTGATNGPTITFTSTSNGLYVYGSLTFVSGVTVTASSSFGRISLYGNGEQTITTSGISLNKWVLYFETATATWSLQDDLTMTGLASIYSYGSTITTNNHNVSLCTLSLDSGTFNAGSSIINITPDSYGYGELDVGNSVVFNCGTSKISFASGVTDAYFYPYAGHAFYEVEFLATSGTIDFYGSATFTNLKFTEGESVEFAGGATQTIAGTFTATGASGNLINFISSSQHYFSKSSGIVRCNYLNLSHSNATGGATWYAGVDSVDTIDNDGWIFERVSTITADGIINAPATKTVSADGLVFATNVLTSTADTIIVIISVETSITADGIIKESFAQINTADGIIRVAGIQTPTADATVKVTTVFSLTTDAIVLQVSEAATTVDAIVRETFVSTATADAIVFATNTYTVTASSLIKEIHEKTFTSDAVILEVQTAEYTADGIVRGTIFQSYTADGIIKHSVVSTFTVDAVIKEILSQSITTDGVVRETLIQIHTADAVVEVAEERTVESDAIILVTTLKTYTVDAHIVDRMSTAVTADGIVKEALVKTHTINGIIAADNFSNSPFYLYIGNDLSIRLGSSRISTWTIAGRPTGITGTIGYNTETEELEVYDGSSWQEVSSGGTGTTSIDIYRYALMLGR